jgi:hypothetical protein
MLAVQVLLTLLLDSQDRPGLGSLEPAAAAAAFENIGKVTGSHNLGTQAAQHHHCRA